MFPEGHSGAFGFEVPARRLNRRLGHTMPANRFHQIPGLTSRLNLLADHHWRQHLEQGHPGAFGPLVAIKRLFASRAFSPAFGALGVNDTYDDDSSFRCATEAGFEEMN